MFELGFSSLKTLNFRNFSGPRTTPQTHSWCRFVPPSPPPPRSLQSWIRQWITVKKKTLNIWAFQAGLPNSEPHRSSSLMVCNHAVLSINSGSGPGDVNYQHHKIIPHLQATMWPTQGLVLYRLCIFSKWSSSSEVTKLYWLTDWQSVPSPLPLSSAI